jgi:hypothetical protein
MIEFCISCVLFCDDSSMGNDCITPPPTSLSCYIGNGRVVDRIGPIVNIVAVQAWRPCNSDYF